MCGFGICLSRQILQDILRYSATIAACEGACLNFQIQGKFELEIRLDHIKIPAKKPDWLAEWYALHFGFKAQGGFVYGPGTLIIFEPGEPSDYQGKTHFGFRCDSRSAVENWAEKFNEVLNQDETYCGFNTADPEGNIFEVYWEV